jgi:hypothetical protein
MVNRIKASDIDMDDELYNISNPIKAQKNAINYLGKDAIIYKSSNKTKKYAIYDPENNKWVNFGSREPPMEDYLKHKNPLRRKQYLKRALNIKGEWHDNHYSPNNLSIYILWSYKE